MELIRVADTTELNKRLTIFTVTNDQEKPGAKVLKESALAWGWDLQWIQQEVGWDITFKAQQLGQMKHLLENIDKPYFLYTDAWDTLFVGPPQELAARLTPNRVTFCGDTILAEAWKSYPWKSRLSPEMFPRVGFGEFPYVNDGVIWGDSQLMCELITDYMKNYRPEIINQDYFNWRVALDLGLHGDKLKVDSRGEVVVNLMGMQSRYLESVGGHRIMYTPTKTMPVVLHYPGLGKDATKVLPQFMKDFHSLRKEAESEG